MGNWASIESKDQSRVSASTISIKTAGIFTFQIRVQPNGLQMGCTIMMQTRFPDTVLRLVGTYSDRPLSIQTLKKVEELVHGETAEWPFIK
jgi:hypothetical protein